MIPTQHVEGSPLLDLAQGVVVDKAPFVDYCFTGWQSPALIEQPDSGLAVSLEGSPECKFFHVYIPGEQNFFAAEPVSAMPNAFNRPEFCKRYGCPCAYSRRKLLDRDAPWRQPQVIENRISSFFRSPPVQAGAE